MARVRFEANEHRPPRPQAVLALLLAVVFGPGLAAQRDAVVWNVPLDLRTVDRRAIVDLACKMGIGNPERVSMTFRSECPLLKIESRAIVNGNRVSSNILHIRRKSGPAPSPGR